MKKRINFFSIGVVWGTPAFLFLIALFLCGVIAGGFTGLMDGAQGRGRKPYPPGHRRWGRCAARSCGWHCAFWRAR